MVWMVDKLGSNDLKETVLPKLCADFGVSLKA
jgi:hypothetical protein